LLLGLIGTTPLLGCEQQQKSAAGFALPDGDAAAGKKAFVELGCGNCHWVAGEDDIPAPTVSPPVPILIGGDVRHPPTDGRLVTAIINPSHDLGPSFKRGLTTTKDGKSRMPNYREQMTVQQLVDIISFIHSKTNQVKMRERIMGPVPDSVKAKAAENAEKAETATTAE
jgi:mono/diheme cytochrome c family protein